MNVCNQIGSNVQLVIVPVYRKREIVGSSPTVDNNLSVCNSRILRMPYSSIKPIQMKS